MVIDMCSTCKRYLAKLKREGTSGGRLCVKCGVWRYDKDTGMEDAHKERHIELHKMLDELIADYITNTKGMPSQNTILDLMQWSHKQTEEPDHIWQPETKEAQNDRQDD